MDQKPALFNISIGFQLVLLVLTVLILSFVFSIPLNKFTAKEHFGRAVHSFDDFKQKSTFRTAVQMGLFIRSFSEFDVVKGDFTFDGIMWFDYDPTKVSVDVLEMFYFQHGEVLKKTEKKIAFYETHNRVSWNIQVRTKLLLDHRDFPLDDHNIAFEVVNQKASELGIVFESSSMYFNSAPDLFLSGWSIVGKQVKSSGIEELLPGINGTTNSYQGVIFVLECMRKDMRHVLSILLPLLLILFFTMYCFSLNTNDLYDARGRTTQHTQTIMNVVLFGVSTLVSYRFIIESLSPDVNYFMLCDYLFFLILLLVVVIFILIAQTYQLTIAMKKIAMIAVYGGLILSCMVLLWLM